MSMSGPKCGMYYQDIHAAMEDSLCLFAITVVIQSLLSLPPILSPWQEMWDSNRHLKC